MWVGFSICPPEGDLLAENGDDMAKTTKQAKKSTKAPKTGKARKKAGAATGAIAPGFHEGSRSEILADYLFSAWGTVTPARRQSDHGLDLYCTLTERLGQLARVREYFSVQVKSEDNALWQFNDAESVKWLVEHPLPLFLCRVNKKKGLVRVYHTIARFQIWALGRLPPSVELIPGDCHDGEFDACAGLPTCHLSAPILEISLADLTDDARMQQHRAVFEYWVGLDRDNCELVRAGLLRFRRPTTYKTNVVASTTVLAGLGFIDNEVLRRGINRLAEAIECIGGQLAHSYRGNLAFGLEAAMLLDRIQKEFVEELKDNHFLATRVPGLLYQCVVGPLRELDGSNYAYGGLDAVEKEFADLPLVKQFLKK
jgi:hypothetical protein